MKRIFSKRLTALITVVIFFSQSVSFAADVTVNKYTRQEMLSPALGISRHIFQMSFINMLKMPANLIRNIPDEAKKKSENDKNTVLIFGGPDGVLLASSKYHKTQLADSPVKDPLIGLLRKKNRIVIVSRQRYEDEPQLKEKGLYSRLISYIPEDLRQYITLYVSNGKYKIEFDKYGKEKNEHEFNESRYMKPWKVQILKKVANEVIDEYWKDCCDSLGEYKNKYHAFTFKKPQLIEHKYANKTYALTLVYLPSKKATTTSLSDGEKDSRHEIYIKLIKRINKKYPKFWKTTNIEMAGLTSIDISEKMPSNNDCALEDYFVNEELGNKQVVFYGDLEYKGEKLKDNDIKEEQDSLKNLGMVAGSLTKLLNDDVDVDSVKRNISHYKLGKGISDGSLYAALVSLNDFKSTSEWKNLSLEIKIEKLYKMYKDYNLSFTNQAAWTVLYKHAFNFSPELNKALDEVRAAFANSNTVEKFFEEVDKIYAEYQGVKKLDFFRFYASVDPRLAKNLYFLRMKVYKNNADLINDAETASKYKKESISRALIGYFQDKDIYGIKDPGLDELIKPDPVVVYVGGGGVATTTFLRKLVEKGLKSVAGLVSSSDDGGSSWKIMLSIQKTFGFYFIPPGDAAGVMIFTGADDAKVFSLFEIETKKRLPEELSTAGKRITAANVLPVWKKRIIDVNRVFNGETKALNLPAKPKDFISFAAGLLTLGDLIDRELIDTEIIELEGMSTANLLVVGAACDKGALKHGKLFDEKTMNLDNLDRLIGAKEQQTLAVSWDYPHSCLMATYENGDKIPFQTLITDRLHKEFLTDLDFVHRIGEKDYSEYENVEEMIKDTRVIENPGDYPKANPDVVKAIEDAKGAIIMGNGSLFTSMLPNFLYSEISEAIIKRRKQGLPVVFIVKIKSDIETSKDIRIVDDKGTIYDKADDIAAADKEVKFMLEIGKTMPLKKQLEIIRNVVEKAITRNNKNAVQELLGKDRLELKDIMSHIVMPDEEFFRKIKRNRDRNRVKIDSKSEAKKLFTALKKGKAQVSKNVKGFQNICPRDRVYLSHERINILSVSEKDIKGIKEKKPMYKNEKLYEITKKLMNEREKSNILCVCNSNFNRSQAMELVFENLIYENGLSRYLSVSSGAVKKKNKDGWGGGNTLLQEAFKDQFGAKSSKKIKSKSLTSYQVRQAEVIVVPNEKVKVSLGKEFKDEIINKRIFVLEDLAKNMHPVEFKEVEDNKNADRLFKIRQIIEEKIWPNLLGSLKALENIPNFSSYFQLQHKQLDTSLTEVTKFIETAI